MDNSPPAVIDYRRARFATQLPTGFLYTRAHFWLLPIEHGLWRVGLTKFATRMLGEAVDFGFDLQPQAPVHVGQKLGWLEGFKAVSDLYSAATGLFLGSNPQLEREVTLINKDPHGAGWLYEVKGTPDPGHLDAAGYVSMLDEVIDELWKKQMGGR
jgi:glycine cleavage system H protein